jgi:hypothetical protein
MALRLFEPNLANVKPDLRRLYVADAEHGYRLDLIDLDEHIGGLKRALAKERELNKKIKANSSGTLDGLAAMSVFGVMPPLAKTKPAPDVRAGLLPTENAAAVHGCSVTKRLARRMYAD